MAEPEVKVEAAGAGPGAPGAARGAPRGAEALASLDALLAQVHALQGALEGTTEGGGSDAEIKAAVKGVFERTADAKAAAKSLEGLTVPDHVVRAVDEGRNPDHALRELFATALERNQQAQGRALALGAMHRAMARELAVAYPEECQAYAALPPAPPPPGAEGLEVPAQPAAG